MTEKKPKETSRCNKISEYQKENFKEAKEKR